MPQIDLGHAESRTHMLEGWHTEWRFAEMRLVFLRNFLEHTMQDVGME
jgi:hypothetical protein